MGKELFKLGKISAGELKHGRKYSWISRIGISGRVFHCNSYFFVDW